MSSSVLTPRQGAEVQALRPPGSKARLGHVCTRCAFSADPTPSRAQSPAPLRFPHRVSGIICRNRSGYEEPFAVGWLPSCLPAVLPFSLSALDSLGVCRQSPGTPGAQILWRAVAGKAGRRGLEHLTPPLFCTQQVRCIRNLKGEQLWRPGGGGGLGEAGAGERPLQRLWCCPSPTGCRTEPGKRQTGFRRRPESGSEN